MKFVRYGKPGKEKPGLIDADGNIRDLTGHVSDIGGEAISPKGLNKLKKLKSADLPLVKGNPRYGPCVSGTGKFICIGLNYADHAAESGSKVPPEPVIFMKATSAIIGCHDNVEIPRTSIETDWEVELGVIIGSHAKYVSEDMAMDHVAGYCVINDVSERSFQKERSGQWTKGKSADTFGPIGPWLVTKDEIADPQNLRMWLDVNGKRRQDGSTATMVYGVRFLVSYLSQFMSLHSGDIISTGTPPETWRCHGAGN
jgi:2-keto-4-pentenoate hydratase/2-oxohepta-3-ene-1,7-dioic acid hydratase in catechol pathway